MKKTELLFLLFLLTNRVFAQSECPCLNFENDKTKPDTIFNLGSKSLAICNGYYENGFVMEFKIKSCEDNSIDLFYDATLEYKFHVENDTLILEDHRLLWSFKTEKFEKPIQAIEKIWVEGDHFKYTRSIVFKPDKGLIINNDFHNEWKSEEKGDWSGNDKLISWTFQLAIKDKEVYEKYFKKYREIFQIDGVHADFYNELSRMYNEKNK